MRRREVECRSRNHQHTAQKRATICGRATGHGEGNRGAHQAKQRAQYGAGFFAVDRLGPGHGRVIDGPEARIGIQTRIRRGDCRQQWRQDKQCCRPKRDQGAKPGAARQPAPQKRRQQQRPKLHAGGEAEQDPNGNALAAQRQQHRAQDQRRQKRIHMRCIGQHQRQQRATPPDRHAHDRKPCLAQHSRHERQGDKLRAQDDKPKARHNPRHDPMRQQKGGLGRGGVDAAELRKGKPIQQRCPRRAKLRRQARRRGCSPG